MMPPDSENKVCKRCLVALDWQDGWIHPIGQDGFVDGVAGHDPVPVDADSVLEHRYRCDFCFAPDPSWTYPCASFTVERFPTMGSTADWAACDDCHEVIEANDRAALARRAMEGGPAFRTVPRSARRQVLQQVRRFQDQFFAARRGDAYQGTRA